MCGVPGDSDVGVRRSHSRDMEHVGESFRILFFFLPDQLNLAGGDEDMARLVVIHILSQQLKKRNKKNQSESKSFHIMCQFAKI